MKKVRKALGVTAGLDGPAWVAIGAPKDGKHEPPSWASGALGEAPGP